MFAVKQHDRLLLSDCPAGLTEAPAAITLSLLHTHTGDPTVRQLLGNITSQAADAWSRTGRYHSCFNNVVLCVNRIWQSYRNQGFISSQGQVSSKWTGRSLKMTHVHEQREWGHYGELQCISVSHFYKLRTIEKLRSASEAFCLSITLFTFWSGPTVFVRNPQKRYTSDVIHPQSKLYKCFHRLCITVLSGTCT